ncbi:DoxX family protein [Candidatus Omnitrophota bacterium]
MKRESLLDLSMFILRLIIGAIFIAHGAQKLFGMFNGIGIEGTTKIIEGLGWPEPYLVAVAWGCIEFVGGIFLAFGILARWAAVAIVLTMLVRLWEINLAYGFFVQEGGIEYNLLVIGACVPLILLGGGSWSVWDV